MRVLIMNETIKYEEVEKRILTIREEQVLLNKDVAELYDCVKLGLILLRRANRWKNFYRYRLKFMVYLIFNGGVFN